jgi:putative addiction module component (TIGR02574 family)
MRAMTKAEIQQEAMRLPPEERQELVEALWESLEREPVDLPDWQRRVLDERLAELEANPDEGSSWEQVEARIWPQADGGG